MNIPKKDVQAELSSIFRIPKGVLIFFFSFLLAGLCVATVTDTIAGNTIIIVNDILGGIFMVVLFVLALRDRIAGTTAFALGVVATLYLFILGAALTASAVPAAGEVNFLFSVICTSTITCILCFFVYSRMAVVLGSVSALYILAGSLLLQTNFIMTNLPLLLLISTGSTITSYYYRKKLESLVVQLINSRLQVEQTLRELQNAQKRIVTQEKLATLGSLVSGISHELRNPLNFINNFAEITGDMVSLMSNQVKPYLKTAPEDVQKRVDGLLAEISTNLKDIGDHGRRGTSIIQSMLMHNRGANSTARPTDFNALVRHGADLALHGYKARERFFTLNMQFDLDDRIGMIDLIPHEFNRVVLNLCSNAFYETHRRSMREAEGGYQPLVQVQTRLEKLDDGKEQVRFSVRDNAWGVPEEYLEKIFLPFFTSKPTGDGTGLGLSMAYEIVTTGHNGSIFASNHPEGGAVFTVILPVKH